VKREEQLMVHKTHPMFLNDQTHQMIEKEKDIKMSSKLLNG